MKKTKIKEICKKCNGTGLVPDMMLRVFTFGMDWLFYQATKDKQWHETCPKCNGKGKITTKIIEVHE